MCLLDGVACFRTLYGSLRQAFQTSADLADCILWILVAHMCVRPSIIDLFRSIVCMKALRATRGNIEEVKTVLARRHGQVASRMESGKRTWRQIVVFGLAPTQVLGVANCGTHNLQRQLLVLSALKGIAESRFLIAIRRLAKSRRSTMLRAERVLDRTSRTYILTFLYRI